MGESLKSNRRGGSSDPKRPRKGRQGREHSRATRGDAYLIHGRRPAQEFLNAGLPHDGIEAVLVSEGMSDRELVEALPRNLTRGLARRDMDELFPDLNHQGIVIKLQPGRTHFDGRDDDWSGFIKSSPGFLLALDEIQDPQNLGSILRSAEALGSAGVFLTGRGTDISPAALRVSAGAAFHIPAYKVANPNRLLDAARQAGYFIVSAAGDPDHASDDSAKGPLALRATERKRFPMAREMLLFIGNEGSGVRPLVRSKSDFLVSIPMDGRIASLNAGVAAGILMDRLLRDEGE